jgi:hypothetical protein
MVFVEVVLHRYNCLTLRHPLRSNIMLCICLPLSLLIVVPLEHVAATSVTGD